MYKKVYNMIIDQIKYDTAMSNNGPWLLNIRCSIITHFPIIH